MASNRPPGVTWESYIDALFRQARENGEFDRLPGAGETIPGWTSPTTRTGGSSSTCTAKSFQLCLTHCASKPNWSPSSTASGTCREDQVRRKLMQLNAQIHRMNSTPADGPALNVSMIDVDAMVKKWREKWA